MILDDNNNPRVQAHGGAALVNFAEDAPKNIKLVQHKRKLVLEQIVTTIAAVADTVEEKFEPYYDK